MADGPYIQSTITTTRNDSGWSTPRITPTHEQLTAAAKRFIQSQHTTLWGRSFNVHDEEADEAAEWLAGQVMAVLRQAWWPNWHKDL